MKKTISVRRHLKKVSEYMEKEKFKEAASTYMYVFSKTNNWHYANEAGRCFQRANMLSKAAGAFKKALRATSHPYEVLIHVGINYALAMDFKKAKKVLEEVLYQTAHPIAAHELGKIAYFQKKWIDALNYFDVSFSYLQRKQHIEQNISLSQSNNLIISIYYHKAKILGLELGHYKATCTMLRHLKLKTNDKKHIFAFSKEAINRGKIKIAKFAALLMIEDYQEHRAIRDLFELLEIS